MAYVECRQSPNGLHDWIWEAFKAFRWCRWCKMRKH